MSNSIYYSSDVKEYNLAVGDKLIIRNKCNMYEPHYDYKYANIPTSVSQSIQNNQAGLAEGASGHLDNVFTFNSSGKFTMTIINNISSTKYNITIKVKEFGRCSIL